MIESHRNMATESDLFGVFIIMLLRAEWLFLYQIGLIIARIFKI